MVLPLLLAVGVVVAVLFGGCNGSDEVVDGPKLLENGIRSFNNNDIVKAFGELQQAVAELRERVMKTGFLRLLCILQ